ncbi:hypothetical protein D9Q98_003586 [Chlorella vulgaris]|uniref:tRNA(His) guanylyltransferase n=1 Tax=Chlorella vulgaris TaxID=3077 RepID=A0A9D4TT67_CHLVU|nr:hypothetical protein D9Q98_003586 [Chlorella vulgaris]
MACSQFEYVKQYETDDRLLPGCWIVLRLDGKGFTKFCELHCFEKPNDVRALCLMDASAQAVMREFQDIRLAFGESDEYSFVFPRECQLYGRRCSKLVSLVASCFTASYVRLWPQHLPDKPLAATPLFDARAVLYPSDRTLRDYLSWRQADTHINNLYNTCFWALVKSGKTNTEAHAQLQGTLADYKNELLFSQFGLNYNALPERFRKGSVVIRQRVKHVKQTADGRSKEKERLEPCVLHCDIIRDHFWQQHAELLA